MTWCVPRHVAHQVSFTFSGMGCLPRSALALPLHFLLEGEVLEGGSHLATTQTMKVTVRPVSMGTLAGGQVICYMPDARSLNWWGPNLPISCQKKLCECVVCHAYAQVPAFNSYIYKYFCCAHAGAGAGAGRHVDVRVLQHGPRLLSGLATALAASADSLSDVALAAVAQRLVGDGVGGVRPVLHALAASMHRRLLRDAGVETVGQAPMIGLFNPASLASLACQVPSAGSASSTGQAPMVAMAPPAGLAPACSGDAKCCLGKDDGPCQNSHGESLQSATGSQEAVEGGGGGDTTAGYRVVNEGAAEWGYRAAHGVVWSLPAAASLVTSMAAASCVHVPLLALLDSLLQPQVDLECFPPGGLSPQSPPPCSAGLSKPRQAHAGAHSDGAEQGGPERLGHTPDGVAQSSNRYPTTQGRTGLPGSPPQPQTLKPLKKFPLPPSFSRSPPLPPEQLVGLAAAVAQLGVSAPGVHGAALALVGEAVLRTQSPAGGGLWGGEGAQGVEEAGGLAHQLLVQLMWAMVVGPLGQPLSQLSPPHQRLQRALGESSPPPTSPSSLCTPVPTQSPVPNAALGVVFSPPSSPPSTQPFPQPSPSPHSVECDLTALTALYEQVAQVEIPDIWRPSTLLLAQV